MIKKLILIGIMVLGISSNHVEAAKKPKLISETHRIYDIQGNKVYGELITGSGEGIFYYKKDFKKFKINIKKGDVVKVYWTKKNYDKEIWDLYDVKLIKKK